MYYRKRDDKVAKHIAQECGCAMTFECVGDRVHEDDIDEVIKLLGVLPSTAFDYFFVWEQ